MGSQSGKQDDETTAKHSTRKNHKHTNHSEVGSTYHVSSSSNLPLFGSPSSPGIQRRLRPEQRIPLPDFGPQALKAVEQEIYLKQAIGEFTFEKDPDLQRKPPELICRDPFFWSRKDDWIPNDPFREWREPKKIKSGEEKQQMTFLESLLKAATTPIGEEVVKEPKDPSLLAGAPLRHHQREKKVAMLPVHGQEEAYALPSLAPPSAPVCIGEIIHAPVLDVAAIADRASRPASMVRPPPSMVLPSAYVGAMPSVETGLRSQVASSMVLPQGTPIAQPRLYATSVHSERILGSPSIPSYQGSLPSSAVRVY